jgi:4-amino-4-deoxy-L-arabinose transferase-like glycosyltransferase
MKENNENGWNSYVKYSAMGFQMLATIAVFAYLGYWIDGKREADDSLFTALLALLGTVASLYQVIRSLGKK